MRIDLSDLGENFKAVGLNDGNDFSGRADGDTLHLRPGAYLLTRNGVTTKWKRDDKWENITLKEFVAPEASVDRTYVVHQPIVEATAGRNLRLNATVVSPREVKKVQLVAYLQEPPAQTDRPEPGQHVQPAGPGRAGQRWGENLRDEADGGLRIFRRNSR
jgi:hypothetical protein